MKKFNYKDVAKEIGWNFDKIKMTTDHPSGYNYYKTVVGEIDKDKTVMLDIGCGSGEKATRFFSGAKKITMIDIEPEMIEKAKANVKKLYAGTDKEKKFKIMLCDGENELPFKDDSFDLVVSRHCGAKMSEVFRVLKKGGIFISEDYAANDCQELKDCYGRGQNYGEKPFQNKILSDCLDAGFSTVNCLQFEEIEYYKTVDDLQYLLERTPILGGFDEKKDMQKLLEFSSLNSSRRGIKMTRRLFALYLVK